jgi:hypothetical protein
MNADVTHSKMTLAQMQINQFMVRKGLTPELKADGFHVDGNLFETLRKANLAALRKAYVTFQDTDTPVTKHLRTSGLTNYVVHNDSITVAPDPNLPLVSVSIEPNTKGGLRVLGFAFGALPFKKIDLSDAFRTVLDLQEKCYSAGVSLSFDPVGVSNKDLVEYPQILKKGILPNMFGKK